MKFSFKALLVLTIICFVFVDEFNFVQEAEAGVVVRRVRSRYRFRPRRTTIALKRTLSRGRAETFGTKSSINKVYAARLKAYKIAVRTWQKEKKLAEKLEKQYAKERLKQQKQEAKARLEMAKRLAKQKERQQIAIAEAKELEDADPKDSKAENKNTKKNKSIFSKLTSKSDSSKAEVAPRKTAFRKDKLKFMSKLFLSLFGKE